jgi:hypothetical protein
MATSNKHANAAFWSAAQVYVDGAMQTEMAVSGEGVSKGVSSSAFLAEYPLPVLFEAVSDAIQSGDEEHV